MNATRVRLILMIIIAGLIGYAVGVTKIEIATRNYQPHVEFSSKQPPPSVSQADFGAFWAVLQRIENSYYDKGAIDPRKILNGAISGMVESLDDPYTVYLPPTQNEEFKDGLAGKFEGIGAELGLKDKQIIIVAPLDGSPAQKAGIRPGDSIVRVNDEMTLGWSLRQAVDKIRGPKGSEVTLAVIHNSGEKPVDVKIVRDTITVESLTSWIKKIKDVENVKQTQALKAVSEEKIIYIRLSQFGDNTNEEWTKLSADVDRALKADKEIKGIVFDLRNNPGGYLNHAVFIASEFVKSGDAVLQEDRNGDRTSFPVSGTGLLTEVPVVVLVNRGSASASEIVAGALRDHDRATLIGETSFGKGTIQQAEELEGGAGIHVTIAKWLTPDGIWVGNGKAGAGLKPDIEVKLNENDPEHDVQLEKAIEELVK